MAAARAPRRQAAPPRQQQHAAAPAASGAHAAGGDGDGPAAGAAADAGEGGNSGGGSKPSSLWAGARAAGEQQRPSPLGGAVPVACASAADLYGALYAPPTAAAAAASSAAAPITTKPKPAPPADIVSFNVRSDPELAGAALSTLAAAMADDPVNSYLLGRAPGSACGRGFAETEIEGFLHALPDAAHFLATRDGAAAALWQLLPLETPRNELLAGWTRILRVPLRRWRAAVRLELAYEAAHAEAAAADEAFYYLSFIASAPAARGRGYGSQLIAAITARADAEGRACHLEATSERSRALYERHGFVTTQTLRVGRRGPPVFVMRREPGAGKAAQPAAVPAPACAAAVAAKAAAPVPAAAPAAAAAPPALPCARALAVPLLSGSKRARAAPSESSDSGDEGSIPSAVVVVKDGACPASKPAARTAAPRRAAPGGPLQL
ncbi:hypothetical protein Rsub_11139 [Raphidocelis subcapitata]|uniref:N-acetyltransferase domain-containing protein n=1 Tax=Raphidocelis subcapitata TaxID=307507 RepID=A0A2V0PDU9_9CHLO|nr:hypothetical protein Rsub_11139 [Raphidocelis subcapitata]|eukprot:GBF98028.1 hypothetical protein Rsub_11139 [Raphidocelis subcapitata]